jgi:hypothetical protein
MPVPIRLEVFETLTDTGAPKLLTPEQIEEIRLNAYERGYNAGWDDAGRQAEEEERARRAEVERQLQQLAFTYHEVRGHLLRALEPVFAALVGAVVPAAARASVVPTAVEQLLALSRQVSEAPVTLRVGPGTRDEFAAALDGLVLPPLTVVESEQIAPLQAAIAFDAQETRIDLAAVAGELAAAIERFYLIQTEEVSHA